MLYIFISFHEFLIYGFIFISEVNAFQELHMFSIYQHCAAISVCGYLTSFNLSSRFASTAGTLKVILSFLIQFYLIKRV